MSDINKKPHCGTFIACQTNGTGASQSVSMSILPDDRVPFFLADNQSNKAISSLDQLFLPIASRSGVGVEEHSLPFLKSTEYYNGQTYWGSRPGKIMVSDPSVVNMVRDVGGLALGIAPNIGSGNTLSTESMLNLTSVSGELRKAIGVRLPMFAVGAGLDMSGNVVGQSYKSNLGEDLTAMKAGPVDLRWDERKHAWVGSDFFSNDIAYGFLSSDITAPSGKYDYTTFTVTRQFFNSGVWQDYDTITCMNKDPNFTMTYSTGSNIFVKAIRLQSPTMSDSNVYMPFYVGCE